MRHARQPQIKARVITYHRGLVGNGDVWVSQGCQTWWLFHPFPGLVMSTEGRFNCGGGEAWYQVMCNWNSLNIYCTYYSTWYTVHIPRDPMATYDNHMTRWTLEVIAFRSRWGCWVAEATFSAGQDLRISGSRYRWCPARPEVLDEPTSGLDSKAAEAQIHWNILNHTETINPWSVTIWNHLEPFVCGYNWTH